MITINADIDDDICDDDIFAYTGDDICSDGDDDIYNDDVDDDLPQ